MTFKGEEAVVRGRNDGGREEKKAAAQSHRK